MYLTNAKVENQLAQLKDGNSSYHLSPYGVEIGKQQLASREFDLLYECKNDFK